MIKRFVVKAVVLSVLLGAMSSGAFAQLTNLCTTGIVWWGIVDGPITSVFPNAQCGPPGSGQGPFSGLCWIFNYRCAPADAASETRSCQTVTCSRPVSLASGDTYIEENDVRLPGLGGGLSLHRIWHSLWPSTQSAFQIGMFGPNWRSTYEERVFLGSDNYIKYGRSDGSFWSFGYGSPTGGYAWSVAAPANMSATLVPGSSYWTITFQNGEQRLFDNSTGHLISIIDRNGNTTQLSYDGSARLVTVTDPASRHLYFAYGSGGASYLVSGVTSDFGVSTSYAYDSSGRLSQVTEQDSSTFNFAYNSQSLITAVTDSMGKTLEAHTYDSSGRGLTASQASGVNAVTISY
jgi:YD repeat-containing protein